MPSTDPNSQHQLIEKLIARPLSERLREHKYRWAQAIIFGLPVIALQYFGLRLGGAESPRYVAIMQMALSAWVTYVAAAGMASEGAILFLTRRRITFDPIVAIVAIALEIVSIVAALRLAVAGSAWFSPLFHWVVLLLIVWTAMQWLRLSAQLRFIAHFAETQTKSQSTAAAESAK